MNVVAAFEVQFLEMCLFARPTEYSLNIDRQPSEIVESQRIEAMHTSYSRSGAPNFANGSKVLAIILLALPARKSLKALLSYRYSSNGGRHWTKKSQFLRNTSAGQQAAFDVVKLKTLRIYLCSVISECKFAYHWRKKPLTG